MDSARAVANWALTLFGATGSSPATDGVVLAMALGAVLPLLWWALSKPARRQFAAGTPVALVVGAAGGIGSHTAKRLAKEGFHVVLADLAEGPLTALAAEIGSANCTAAPTNITDADAVEDLARTIAQLSKTVSSNGSPQSSPRLDVVVLAAGAAHEGLFDAVPTASHLLALNVNAGGMVRVLQAVQPLLMATSNSAVITVGSATCHPWAMPEYGGYAMSKAAQRALTETLAIEWAHHGISVCDVIPPAVDTPFVTGQSTPASIHGHFMAARVSPDSVAQGIVSEATNPSGSVHVALDPGVLALGVLSGVFPCLKVPLVRFLGQPNAAKQEAAGAAVRQRLQGLVDTPAKGAVPRSRSRQRSQ